MIGIPRQALVGASLSKAWLRRSPAGSISSRWRCAAEVSFHWLLASASTGSRFTQARSPAAASAASSAHRSPIQAFHGAWRRSYLEVNRWPPNRPRDGSGGLDQEGLAAVERLTREGDSFTNLARSVPDGFTDDIFSLGFHSHLGTKPVGDRRDDRLVRDRAHGAVPARR